MSPRAAIRHPAAWYLGIALVLPAARGAEIDGVFAEHAVTVLATAAAVLAARGIIRRLARPGGPGAAVAPRGPQPR